MVGNGNDHGTCQGPFADNCPFSKGATLHSNWFWGAFEGAAADKANKRGSDYLNADVCTDVVSTFGDCPRPETYTLNPRTQRPKEWALNTEP